MSACTHGSGGVGDGSPGPAPTAGLKELKYASRYHLPPEYAQWERPYQESLEETAINRERMNMSLPPVDAAFVRFVHPDDAGSVLAGCLREQGFEATVEWDGGVSYGSQSADQQPAMLVADFRCDVMFPVHPKYTMKHTETQIRIVYDFYVNELVPCLRAEGYDDIRPAPTWESFLSTYHSKEPHWFPFDAVSKRQEQLAADNGGVLPANSHAEWRRINEACPQGPSVARLFSEGK